jgi:hypothetical protein
MFYTFDEKDAPTGSRPKRGLIPMKRSVGGAPRTDYLQAPSANSGTAILTKEKRPMPDDKDQSKRFIEKAREIEADDERSAADELMKRLAKTPPEPRKKRQRK